MLYAEYKQFRSPKLNKDIYCFYEYVVFLCLGEAYRAIESNLKLCKLMEIPKTWTLFLKFDILIVIEINLLMYEDNYAFCIYSIFSKNIKINKIKLYILFLVTRSHKTQIAVFDLEKKVITTL